MALRIPLCIEYTFHTPLLTRSVARYSMRALTALCTFQLLVGVLFMGQEDDYSKVEMKVTKVAGNVYMLEGAGGNIGASVWGTTAS